MAESLRPMKIGELNGIRTAEGKQIRAYLLSSPLMPDVFSDKPDLAVRRAIEGARLAQELGASVFGLGAFWSVVGNKGQDVQAAVPGGAAVAVIVDAASFARRFTGLGERMAERREAWRAWGEAHGVAPVVVDLEAADAAAAGPLLQAAFASPGAVPAT